MELPRMAFRPQNQMMPSPTGPRSQALEPLLGRIQARTAKVGIIGLGYVGLPLALLFNEAGFPVTGFDIDPEKVKALNNGRSYIYRIPQTEIAAAAPKASGPRTSTPTPKTWMRSSSACPRL